MKRFIYVIFIFAFILHLINGSKMPIHDAVGFLPATIEHVEEDGTKKRVQYLVSFDKNDRILRTIPIEYVCACYAVPEHEML